MVHAGAETIHHAAEPLFDAHAHIMAADAERYPPSAEGRGSATQPYAVEQLLADMDAAGVAQACAVQRYHYYYVDNSYVLDAARAHADRLSAVVMLDGLDERSSSQLRALAERQRLGGLRLATLRHTRYDTAWLNGPAAMRLWEEAAKLGLPVCVICYVRHVPYNLPALGMIAELFPETPIVVDHLGMQHGPVQYLPLITEGRPLPFAGPPDYGVPQALLALRERRNLYFKLTGINLEYLEAQQVEAAPFVRRFVDLFGADRVMCGTDIGQTHGPYARIVAAIRASLALLDADERAAVLFGTARGVFGSGTERGSAQSRGVSRGK
jgi:predicted TIM-barrel fold metal-dependent hydrolase